MSDETSHGHEWRGAAPPAGTSMAPPLAGTHRHDEVVLAEEAPASTSASGLDRAVR
jgi:hypothetical protein